ncbi:MAG TPA: SDR family oxidoreductase, partial [Acidimicrobiales bacterium]|nr:SDR family oxidoreductase [Acidimicrobiales bacterium]
CHHRGDMELTGKVVVVTGGASGIGEAMCERFGVEGAAAVVVADQDDRKAAGVAARLSASGSRARAVRCDVADEDQVVALVERTEAEIGPIDLFCSNAGIAIGGGVEVPDADWERIWRVNVMAHVYAARALVPRMSVRGGGYLLATASAAGLLTNLGSAPYSVTKHAAVALAEWLSITHAREGIRVSCLCPQGVRTPMLLGGLDADEPSAASVLAAGEMIEPTAVADAVVDALAAERFLVLPHPEVALYERHRADDRERWLAGMRRLWDGMSE